MRTTGTTTTSPRTARSWRPDAQAAGDAGYPDFWMTYLSSADAKATAAAAAEAGGQVMLEPMAVMDLGAMAVLGDPTGGAVGVWQPGRHRGLPGARPGRCAGVARGAHPRPRRRGGVLPAGVRLAHLGGQRHRRVPLHHDDRGRGAVRRHHGRLRVPARGNALVLGGLLRGGGRRRSLATAERLGGTVLEPAVDTPYGRMARVADPTGASFKIVAARLTVRAGGGRVLLTRTSARRPAGGA